MKKFTNRYVYRGSTVPTYLAISACDGCVLCVNHSSSLGTSDTGSMNVRLRFLLSGSISAAAWTTPEPGTAPPGELLKNAEGAEKAARQGMSMVEGGGG